MPLPQAREAREFYRCSFQRFEDADILLKAERTTGARYLAGYGVECMLKALVLSVVPQSQRTPMLVSFRSGRGHNLEWLKKQYREHGGAPFPPEVARAFTVVNTWTTEWRYTSGTSKRREAMAFFRATQKIMDWAHRRL